jgi:hypothetical protein
MKPTQVSKHVWISQLTSLFMLLAMGCGTHVGNPEEEASTGGPVMNQPRSPDERVTFALAHGSYDPASKLDIYINSLSIRSSSSENDEAGWISIPLDSSEPIDLLSFKSGDFYNIAGSGAIPDGVYSELRLVLDPEQAAVMTLKDGSVHQLKVPSGSESGIKIKGDIIIDGEQDNIYVMKFDLERSIIRIGADAVDDRGNPGRGQPPIDPPGLGRLQDSNTPTYLLQPVVQLVRERESGGISGESPNGNLVCVYQDIAEADEEPSCESAIATGRVKNGRYHLPFLPQGVYDMRIFDSNGNYEDVLGVNVERRTGRL